MIKSVIPKLPFIEKQKTLDFYINQLHFDLLADYGDYFLVNKDSIELHFFSFSTLIPEKSDFMIYFRLDTDIENFYQTLKGDGIAIHPNGKLEIKPWHQKEFSILDPNGTLLTYGQALI